MESYPLIQEELRALRPEMRVYYDADRYGMGVGQSELALPWIKHCHDAQPTLIARPAFLAEAMREPDFQHE